MCEINTGTTTFAGLGFRGLLGAADFVCLACYTAMAGNNGSLLQEATAVHSLLMRMSAGPVLLQDPTPQTLTGP